MVLLSAISVHAREHPLLMDGQSDGDAHEVGAPPESPEMQEAPRGDVDLQTEGDGLHGLLDEAQQRAAMPKARGKKSIVAGVLLLLALLVYGAIAAKREGVANGVLDVLRNPNEAIGTKARAVGAHVLNPTALTPLANLLLMVYAASFALLLSGLFEFLKTKGFISKLKKMQHELTTLPELPPDLRARNLMFGGAGVAAGSSLGLLLNLDASLYYIGFVGLGVFFAGVLLAVAEMIQHKKTPKEVLFPGSTQNDSKP